VLDYSELKYRMSFVIVSCPMKFVVLCSWLCFLQRLSYVSWTAVSLCASGFHYMCQCGTWLVPELNLCLSERWMLFRQGGTGLTDTFLTHSGIVHNREEVKWKTAVSCTEQEIYSLFICYLWLITSWRWPPLFATHCLKWFTEFKNLGTTALDLWSQFYPK
jgi:hypothetical protein